MVSKQTSKALLASTDDNEYDLIHYIWDLCKGMSCSELKNWKSKANALPDVDGSKVKDLFNELIDLHIQAAEALVI
ncbi:hypothetical protein [Paenibacillus oryzisoli]|uniref:Uncharacterized protein n=1 Tax=Paenibacillus oryzisoli TaxID=1850517 RepID=A0A198A8S3_9BACL|nr:hypothetical protein [Paenibacillus oryzisoli]OAS17471.1 hypothetical protein A8708_22155 [Paenibacillus oryzisoli]